MISPIGSELRSSRVVHARCQLCGVFAISVPLCSPAFRMVNNISNTSISCSLKPLKKIPDFVTGVDKCVVQCLIQVDESPSTRLTPSSRGLENLAVVQLVQKFSAFYEIWRYITVFTWDRPCPYQSNESNSCRHTVTITLFSHMCTHAPNISSWFDHCNNRLLGEKYKAWSSLYETSSSVLLHFHSGPNILLVTPYTPLVCALCS
jgi:hypothetical protein